MSIIDGSRLPGALQPFAERLEISYATPADPLKPYVSGYHRYRLRLEAGERLRDVFFPAWANLRFTWDAEPWSITIGQRRFSPVPACSLFGPTSHAGYSDAGRGTLTGAGLTPLGWARLIRAEADRFADRIVQSETVLGRAVHALAHALSDGGAIEEKLDAWFLDRLDRSEPEDPGVAALARVFDDPSISSVVELERRSGLSGTALQRVARSAFGFTPKLLLRRARFMRALFRVQMVAPEQRAEVILAAGYFDRSHFVRDSRSFLDMPLRDFLALPKPLNEASVRLREEVLGAPAQALHSLSS